MIMADILKIFLLIVGLLTVFVSYWLIAQAFTEPTSGAWSAENAILGSSTSSRSLVHST